MVSAIVTGIVVAAKYGIVYGLIAGAIAAYTQIEQQKAMDDAKAAQEAARREAEARADAAKGTQLVISGDISTLRVLYGRNLVGGTRVYHNTFHNYTATAALDSFKRFKASTKLDANLKGNRHEFLITQQVIGFGGIENCYVVDVDDRRIDGENINEYNEVVYDGSGTRVSPYEHGAMVSVSFNGSRPDPICYENDSTRMTAYFTNLAYATGVFRLNRDDPQFGGVPVVQMYVEGLKVKTIQGSEGARFLSASTVYSNNPALVLLDYLTNNVYGRGLSVSQIDLDTFYKAYLICEKVVMPSVPLEGKLWRAKGGTRAIKRFECNIGLDTSATIRDNIGAILDTMEDAKLIWSGGKYKLVIDYPLLYDTSTTYFPGEVVQYTNDGLVGLYECVMSNSNVAPTTTGVWKDYIKAYITDDDIIRDGESTVSWPNSQTRLNFCTVRYINESKDFKEDTVSWPKKTDPVYATYLAQDSGIALEIEVFATGVTSYYHALAKAENLVRQSRVGVTYSFTLNRDYIHLEPGDKIRLTSDTLGIPGDLLSISEVDPDGDGRIHISAVKFDAAALAWNVADHEYVPPRKIYNTDIPNIAVNDIVFTEDNDVGHLTWPAVNDTRVTAYIVYTTDNYIGADTVWVDRGTVSTTRFDLHGTYASDYYVTVVPVTTRGQKPPKAGWPVKMLSYHKLGTVQNFTYTQNYLGFELSWDAITSARLSGYEIRQGGTSWDTAAVIAFQKASEFQLPPQVAGARIFRIKALDSNGVYADTDATLTITVTAPLSVSITPNVVDNNVMLYWNSPVSQQKVSYFEVRKGDDYNTAQVMGKVYGLFSTFFELSGGTYRYWITPYDVADNKGISNSVVVSVSQPPDYILRNNITSSLTSTTYRTLTSSGVSAVNDYTASGYYASDYMQRYLSMPTGSWVQEVHDLGEGSVINIVSSKATVLLDYVVTSGTPVITVYITGSTDNVTYSPATAGLETNLYNFRYVKVRVEVTGGTITLQGCNLKLSSKSLKETGTVACNASDAGGTTVTFTRSYVDVVSISVTPLGTTPVIPVYDFADVPNPTSFKILLFNKDGVRVSGNASYTIEGVA